MKYPVCHLSTTQLLKAVLVFQISEKAYLEFQFLSISWSGSGPREKRQPHVTSVSSLLLRGLSAFAQGPSSWENLFCALETTAYCTVLSSGFDIIASVLHTFLFQQTSRGVNQTIWELFMSQKFTCLTPYTFACQILWSST